MSIAINPILINQNFVSLHFILSIFCRDCMKLDKEMTERLTKTFVPLLHNITINYIKYNHTRLKTQTTSNGFEKDGRRCFTWEKKSGREIAKVSIFEVGHYFLLECEKPTPNHLKLRRLPGLNSLRLLRDSFSSKEKTIEISSTVSFSFL